MNSIDRVIGPLGVRHVPSVRVNFIATLLGNASLAACQWGMLVAIARFGSEQLVGRYALGLAIASPLFLFASFKLRAVLATDAKSEFSFDRYFQLRMVSTLSVVAVAACTAAGALEGSAARVVCGIALVKAADSISDIAYGCLQQHERMKAIAASQALRGVLGLGSIAGGLVFASSLELGIGIQFVSWSVVAIIDLILALRTCKMPFGALLRLRSEPLILLTRRSLPLGFVLAMGSVRENVPRYYLAAIFGDGALGRFATVYYLVVIGNMVIAAMGQVASPRLARLYACRDKVGFQQLLIRLVLLGFAVGVVGVIMAALFGTSLLSVIYGDEYASLSGVLVWLATVAAFNYSHVFLGTAVTAMRQFFIQIRLQGVGLIATTAAAFVCIPNFGLVGAAWSLLVGSLAGGAMHVLVLRRIGAANAQASGVSTS